MKIQRMWSVNAASIALLSAVAGAQTPPRTTSSIPATTSTLTPQGPVQRITFAEAVDLALKQNLAVRQAENTVDLQNISARQAGQGLIPNLNFSVGGNNSYGRAFDPTTGNITNKNTQSANTGVSSGFTVFDFGRTRGNIAAQKLSAEAASDQLIRSRQDAVYQVALGFVSYVSAQGRLAVQQENLTAQQLSEQQIQRFAEAGARPVSDLYQQRANVAAAQLSVTQQEATVEAAKFSLMQTLQLDPAKDYDFVAPVIPDSISNRTYNLDSLVRIAYSQRSDISAAQARVESTRRQIKSVSAARMPSFNVNANYGSSGNSQAAQNVSWSDQFNQNKGGSVGFSLGLPIFDRGNTSLNRQSAEIQLENNELALANTRQTVALDVRRAWYNVRSAQQQLISAQAGLVAATQALDAVQQRYNVGAATLLDVTNARATRVTAASALNDARYNLVLNQAALGYFTGELDPRSMTLIR
jgi:outer membrane protein